MLSLAVIRKRSTVQTTSSVSAITRRNVTDRRTVEARSRYIKPALGALERREDDETSKKTN